MQTNEVNLFPNTKNTKLTNCQLKTCFRIKPEINSFFQASISPDVLFPENHTFLVHKGFPKLAEHNFRLSLSIPNGD